VRGGGGGVGEGRAEEHTAELQSRWSLAPPPPLPVAPRASTRAVRRLENENRSDVNAARARSPAVSPGRQAEKRTRCFGEQMAFAALTE